ncbi:MAG TPA: site-specific DNA-methyltransferase [Ruminococcus sp.]|nr:site-specific DNA-methyltransferase [Ruminococcus sp.]
MQTVITDVSYDRTLLLMRSEYEKLSENGCFFAIVRTEYDQKGNVLHDLMDVVSSAVEIGYVYVNTIVYPTALPQRAAFTDNVKYVVWLCKNRSAMKFNKDAIREKHIWKDVEWGKRAKNYNPKGKDPGNVWIPTKDDGMAHITEHIMLGDEGVIQRLLDMSGCGDDCTVIREERELRQLERRLPKERLSAEKLEQSKVIFGSSEDMSGVPDESVRLAVTSPPYWNLKDYFKKGQIGQEDYRVYLERMKAVWAQCYRKLTLDGSLWININIRIQGGRVITIPHDIIKMCREIGYYYKGILIWHKSSGIPTGEKNIVDRHEYVLVFSKSEEFFADPQAMESCCDYKSDRMNGGALWNINRKAGSVGKQYIHPAIYPNELVARIVRAATAPGDTVLDPFLGSGTSLIAAEQCGRRCIGFEYNEGFRELMELRFSQEIPDANVEISGLK